MHDVLLTVILFQQIYYRTDPRIKLIALAVATTIAGSCKQLDEIDTEHTILLNLGIRKSRLLVSKRLKYYILCLGLVIHETNIPHVV